MAHLWQRLTRSWYRWRHGEAAYRTHREAVNLVAWEAAGRPAPPPHAIKVAAVRAFAERFGCTVLVETGTYKGDMIVAARDLFDTVHSIELAPALAAEAVVRFRDDPGVTIHAGDSGELLGDILASATGRCLLWLDGHWSGGMTALGDVPTPILRELDHVLHVADAAPIVLIDDARCFGGEPRYPDLDTLKAKVHDAQPDWIFEVEDDIIRTHAPADA